jgi:hypothetical protein
MNAKLERSRQKRTQRYFAGAFVQEKVSGLDAVAIDDYLINVMRAILPRMVHNQILLRSLHCQKLFAAGRDFKRLIQVRHKNKESIVPSRLKNPPGTQQLKRRHVYTLDNRHY